MSLREAFNNRVFRSFLWASTVFSSGTGPDAVAEPLEPKTRIENADMHIHDDQHAAFAVASEAVREQGLNISFEHQHSSHAQDSIDQHPAAIHYYKDIRSGKYEGKDKFEDEMIPAMLGSRPTNIPVTDTDNIDLDSAASNPSQTSLEVVLSQFTRDYEAIAVPQSFLQSVLAERDKFTEANGFSTKPSVTLFNAQSLAHASSMKDLHILVQTDNPSQAEIMIPIQLLTKFTEAEMLDMLEHELAHYQSALINPEFDKLLHHTGRTDSLATPEQLAEFYALSRKEELRADSTSLTERQAYEARFSWIAKRVAHRGGQVQDADEHSTHPGLQQRAELAVRIMARDPQRTNEQNLELLNQYADALPFDVVGYYEQFSQLQQQATAMHHSDRTPGTTMSLGITSQDAPTVTSPQDITARVNKLELESGQQQSGGGHPQSDYNGIQQTPNAKQANVGTSQHR